jgi:hypothetical protein
MNPVSKKNVFAIDLLFNCGRRKLIHFGPSGTKQLINSTRFAECKLRLFFAKVKTQEVELKKAQ